MDLDAARRDAGPVGSPTASFPAVALPDVDVLGTGPEGGDSDAPSGSLPGSWDHLGRACARLDAGGAVVVTSDDAEGPHWLVLAAASATPQTIAFLARHSSGVLAVALRPDRIASLGLLPRAGGRHPAPRGALVTTVRARGGIDRGDAAGLARAVRLLGDATTRPRDLSAPGPIRVLRADPLGVAGAHRGPEAAVDLVAMTGSPAAVLAELVDEDGELSERQAAREFARTHQLPVASVRTIAEARLTGERLVRREATTELPTRHGTLRATGFVGELDGAEHVALSRGLDADAPARRPHAVVHLQRWCLGTVVGARSCGCAEHLDRALRRLARAPAGVVVCVRADATPETGLGHGLGGLTAAAGGGTSAGGGHGLGRLDAAAAAQIVTSFGVTSATLVVADRRQVTALRREGVLVRAAMTDPVRHPAATGAEGRTPARPAPGRMLAG